MGVEYVILFRKRAAACRLNGIAGDGEVDRCVSHILVGVFYRVIQSRRLPHLGEYAFFSCRFIVSTVSANITWFP